MKNNSSYSMIVKAELEKQGAFEIARTYARAAMIASIGLSLAALITAASLFF